MGMVLWFGSRNIIKKNNIDPETKAHNTSVILFLGQRFTDPTSETAPARRRNATRFVETKRIEHTMMYLYGNV